MSPVAASLSRTDDEQELGRVVRTYAERHFPLSDVREARQMIASERRHRQDWTEMVRLGWPTLFLPGALGGADADLAMLGVVAEELGRFLSDVPLVTTAMAVTCLTGETSSAARSLTAGVVAGEALVVLAAQEGWSHAPFDIETVAALSGDAFVINGTKRAIRDADIADYFIVATRTSERRFDRDGITLLLVPGAQAGIQRSDTMGVDSQWTSQITFVDVAVSADSVVGQVGDGASLLERSFAVGTLLTACEMVGAASAAFEQTVAYLKEREQFGVPIGSFQALQHRIARVWVDFELAKSAVVEAMRSFDLDPEGSEAAVSMAKAMINDSFRQIAAEGLQMHGGLGMTDEADIGLFLKRARVAEQTLGTSGFHRDRFATALNF